MAVERVNLLWSSDISYVPLPGGFIYLVTTIRLVQPVRGRLEVVEHARRVFLQEMLEEALGQGTLEVFNTDQEVQFTADARTRRLKRAGVSVSMDGRGRCLDKVFVERLWISVNYEGMYLKGHEVVPELEGGLRSYMGF